MKYLRIYSIHQHNFRTIYLFLLLSLLYLTTVYPETRFLANDYNIFMNSAVDDNYLLMSDDPNTSEWLICGTNSWEDLKTYLPEAKSAGLSISVVVLPPYQSDPVCSEGSFSEPFEQDYILWAQEIAYLSLRYSNLISYRIEDLQENLNLGYLRASYIDSIITAGNSINPRLQFITFHKIFYVDRDASGTGDGSSWGNAANSLDDINWTLVTLGDTVYVSGGADSTTYGAVNIYQASGAYWNNMYVRDGLAVIAPSWEPGHNGGVYFVNSDTTKRAFAVWGTSNLKITGFNVYSTAPVSYPSTGALGATMFFLKEDSLITIDNCNIYSDGRSDPVYLEKARNMSITNNHIESLSNTYRNDQDPIQIYEGGGGHTITGNTIKMGAAATDAVTAHRDGIQWNTREGLTYNQTSTIANNFIYQSSASATNVNSGIYLSSVGSNRFLIYNNIIKLSAANAIPLFINDASPDDAYALSDFIFNNTFITSGYGAPLQISGLPVDTLVIKNNILYGSGIYSLNFSGGFATIDYLDVDFNQHYLTGNANGRINRNVQENLTFAQWQGLGYDVNGGLGNVTFDDITDSVAIAFKLVEGSSGIDDGTVISIFSTDIEGTLRPVGTTWDKGAFEHVP